MNEELQSTNEELETINDELRERTGELNQVNEFLEAILTSLGLGVAVLDAQQRVQVWNRPRRGPVGPARRRGGRQPLPQPRHRAAVRAARARAARGARAAAASARRASWRRSTGAGARSSARRPCCRCSSPVAGDGDGPARRDRDDGGPPARGRRRQGPRLGAVGRGRSRRAGCSPRGGCAPRAARRCARAARRSRPAARSSASRCCSAAVARGLQRRLRIDQAAARTGSAPVARGAIRRGLLGSSGAGISRRRWRTSSAAVAARRHRDRLAGEQPRAVVAADELAVAGELGQRGRDGRPARADQLADQPVREHERHGDPVARRPVPSARRGARRARAGGGRRG